MVNIDDNKVKNIGKVLNDNSRPLKERFRALFTLKNLGGSTAIECINQCFKDESALLKHELAYCLGQMQDVSAIPVLIKVLENKNQEPMVRHEAAEALGAIGDPQVKALLELYAKDPIVEVAETCQIALERLNWLTKPAGQETPLSVNPYASVDPAPPSENQDVEILKKTLLDESLSLYERYRAMFALRNMRTHDSVVALGQGLKASSALFRHEIAFVLGQMQHESSVPFLIANLEDGKENEMVRHECAEALGAIATPVCMDVLQRYLADSKLVVKESCEIALDMCEYENSPEFQYANMVAKADA